MTSTEVSVIPPPSPSDMNGGFFHKTVEANLWTKVDTNSPSFLESPKTSYGRKYPQYF